MVSEADVVSTFPVMLQLWTHLKEDEYLEAVERMRRSGYRLFRMSNFWPTESSSTWITS